MYNLAVHYQRGEGVAQDLTVGFDYFLQAANADFAPAMHQVALCYIDGKGVSKSTDEAKLWLQKAAQKDHEPATELLNKLTASQE